MLSIQRIDLTRGPDAEACMRDAARRGDIDTLRDLVTLHPRLTLAASRLCVGDGLVGVMVQGGKASRRTPFVSAADNLMFNAGPKVLIRARAPFDFTIRLSARTRMLLDIDILLGGIEGVLPGRCLSDGRARLIGAVCQVAQEKVYSASPASKNWLRWHRDYPAGRPPDAPAIPDPLWWMVEHAARYAVATLTQGDRRNLFAKIWGQGAQRLRRAVRKMHSSAAGGHGYPEFEAEALRQRHKLWECMCEQHALSEPPCEASDEIKTDGAA
jgi:hypothetical protein